MFLQFLVCFPSSYFLYLPRYTGSININGINTKALILGDVVFDDLIFDCLQSEAVSRPFLATLNFRVSRIFGGPLYRGVQYAELLAHRSLASLKHHLTPPLYFSSF